MLAAWGRAVATGEMETVLVYDGKQRGFVRGPEEGAGMGELELMSRYAWGRGTKV